MHPTAPEIEGRPLKRGLDAEVPDLLGSGEGAPTSDAAGEGTGLSVGATPRGGHERGRRTTASGPSAPRGHVLVWRRHGWCAGRMSVSAAASRNNRSRRDMSGVWHQARPFGRAPDTADSAD